MGGYGGIGRHIGFKLRCLEREGSSPSIHMCQMAFDLKEVEQCSMGVPRLSIKDR